VWQTAKKASLLGLLAKDVGPAEKIFLLPTVLEKEVFCYPAVVLLWSCRCLVGILLLVPGLGVQSSGPGAFAVPLASWFCQSCCPWPFLLDKLVFSSLCVSLIFVCVFFYFCVCTTSLRLLFA
jgi:hypothetical protein